MRSPALKGVVSTIPLSRTFRFAHEPVLIGSTPELFIGREADLDVLAERLLFSHGGSFLITGYRGVGKTSFVNRVVDRMKGMLGWANEDLGNVRIIPIQLTLARAVMPVELMHLVLRRLYDELVECGLFDELPRDLRADIYEARQRTSMTLTRKEAESFEKTYGVAEASMAAPGLAGKVNWGRKETLTRGDELVFLAYDEKSAEHDLLRIARRLSRGYPIHEARWARFRRRMRRGAPPVRILKFIFVFDEIDKLDDVESVPADALPTRYLDDLLASLKNVLTTSGISFLFVAGKDLHDRWLLDLSRGDSIYESVFCYDKYLGCMWDDVAEIATRFVSRAHLGMRDTDALTDFEEFLRYKGRGIPRRIIRTFNEYVRWNHGDPSLRFTRSDLRRFRFYADLQKVLSGRDEALFGSIADEASTERDRQRLGAYYFVDWILAHGVQPFTIEQGVAASRELSRKIAPAKEVAPDVIRHIVENLVDEEVLERIDDLPGQTMIVNPRQEAVARYRLTRRRLTELGHFIADAESVPVTPLRTPTPENLRVLSLIAQGGMSSVYRAWDEIEGRDVAVKMVDFARLGHDPTFVDRIRSEAIILKSLRHPNIVRFLRFVDQKTRVYIVMDLIDGTTLRKVLRVRDRLPAPVAIWIARVIADALDYIHARGIIRLDLKPDNVLLRSDGTVFLTDFGISKSLTLANSKQIQTGIVVGTPLYMAPEQFEGVVDARCDIYSFGAMLFEMLTGKLPYGIDREDRKIFDILRKIRNGKRPSVAELADVPGDIDTLVGRSLSSDAESRPSLELIRQVLTTYSKGVSQAMVQDVVRGAAWDADRADSQEDRMTQSWQGSVAVSVIGRRMFANEATGAIPVEPSQIDTLRILGEPEPMGRLSLPATGVLEVLRPSSLAGNRFVVIPGHMRIGRSAECDLPLDHESVSRFHADVELVDGSFFISDLNSANGVFVDGERTRHRKEIRLGSRIHIGAVELRLDSRGGVTQETDVPAESTRIVPVDLAPPQ